MKDTTPPFHWERQPEAEQFLFALLEDCRVNAQVAHLEEELKHKTSTRLFDWIDHFVVEESPSMEKRLQSVGFVVEKLSEPTKVYHHPGGLFPRVVLNSQEKGVAVKAERIADFLMVRGLSRPILGSVLGGYRRCLINNEQDIHFWVVERRDTRSMQPTFYTPEHLKLIQEAKEKWQSRSRSGDEEKDIEEALNLADELRELVGENRAAWIVLEVERELWQSKNFAGQIQKARQDKLGMGWANHDHHTFRSSRKHFRSLVKLFESLGFFCRERFYAGKEAGWGAQVMENEVCGLVLFLDVDLDPEEVAIDFAKMSLAEKQRLGTIGLWCGLHGDSILQAGMHHLEAQFDFASLQKDLEKIGISMMKPFSDFSYLKQAFTHGEVWHVAPQRVEKLLKHKQIKQEEAERFLTYGAVGSHLENLQREEGYKGFNQKNVSDIIKRVDPRSISNVQ